MSSINEAARAARAGQELLQASGDVIARRLEIVAEAVRDPLKADYAELALMGSEKVEALAASARAGLTGALAVAGTANAVAARETAAAGRAFDAVMAARTPAEAMTAQGVWAAEAMARSMRDGWALGGAMLRLQAGMLKPIHAAATANAKRLRK
jgi:hypothetical protein